MSAELQTTCGQLTRNPSAVGHGSAAKLPRCASILSTTSWPHPDNLIAMLLQQLQGSKELTHPGWLGSMVRLTAGECRLKAKAKGSLRQLAVCGKGKVRRLLRAAAAQGVEGRLMGREPPARTKLVCKQQQQQQKKKEGERNSVYCRLKAKARGSLRQLVVCGKGKVRRVLRAAAAQGVEGRLMGREPPARTKLVCEQQQQRRQQQSGFTSHQGTEGRLMGREPPARTKLVCIYRRRAAAAAGAAAGAAARS